MYIKKFESFTRKPRVEIEDREEDPIPDITFLKWQVDNLLNCDVEGYYLEKDGKFIGFSKDSDKPLHKWIEDRVGKWDSENSDEWSKYLIHDPEGDVYSW
jgi:hypothetical protein